VSKTKKLLVFGGIAAAAISMAATATTALADPPSGTIPANTDIVGTGSDTTQFVIDQAASDYDATHTTGPQWYSFDAVGSPTIQEKAGCDPNRTRPNGSGAGIAELEANLQPSGDTTDYCVDFARSSSSRSATDPTSIIYLPFGIDGVTWSADTYAGKTNAVGSLTTADLNAIYSCDDSALGGSGNPVTWNEVGGKSKAAVVPVIPQSSSGTRKFFLKEIGVTTLGSCVQGQDNSVEENEGTAPIFQSSDAPNIVFPYSIAVYLAQTQYGHGAGMQGTQVLRKVNGKAPTVGTAPNKKINSGFPYLREVNNVVRNAATSGNPVVPQYLRPIFGNGTKNTGWLCTNATAKADVKSYGFLPDPNCGLAK
jgi:ABC-type phosphate transport system substrate-binding protein